MIRRLAAGFSAAMMLVACGVTGEPGEITPQPAAEAPPAADPEILDLLLVTGSDGKVTVINPDGTLVRELRGPTVSGHPSLQPTWAPVSVDGRRLVAWTELGDDGSFSIALGNVDTGEVTRYPSPVAPFYYYWSPDATLLAFLGQAAFSPLEMGVLDYRRDSLEIVATGQPFYFDWRPDSRAIVTHVDEALSLLTLTGDKWSSEDIPIRAGMFQAPAWLSGDRILTVTTDSPGSVQVSLGMLHDTQDDNSVSQRLILSDLQAGSVLTLAELEGAAIFEPDPTGKWVAVYDYSGPLRVLDLAGGGETLVTESEVAAFEWSPAGDRLLFMEVDRQARALKPRVWDGRDTLVFPSFLPSRVWVVQYLPFWDQYSRSLTLWSPTGEAFTYPGTSSRNGEDQIFVQHLDESQPITVGNGVFASWSPVPQGRELGS
ncbi:MAG: hypothetical protein OXI56_12640 [bacterium]|nr:hypothetical protein [bacterium]MDE0602635.1 hypothetical protein [bacterium]